MARVPGVGRSSDLRSVSARLAVAIGTMLTCLVVVVVPRTVFAVPEPSVTITPSDITALVGEPVTFTVTFTNTGTDPGYVPYVDIRLPAAGIDGDPADPAADPFDGLTFDTAAYLGAPVSTTVIDCTGADVTHPLTNAQVPCPAGEQLVVVQVPFGSFVPGQSASISITLDASPLADIGVELPFTVTPGFASGDSPTGTTPIIGPPADGTYTPEPMTFEKTYVGPEDETATGPNYARTYRLVADVPDGQTLSDVVVTDRLPDSIVYLGADAGGGTITAEPTVGVVVDPGDSTLTVEFDSVTGGAGPEDVVVEVQFYVNDVDAGGAPVIDPTTGAPVSVYNDGEISGTYTPLDTRDDPLGFTINPDDTTIDDEVITARSIATQKSVESLAGDGVVLPGGRLRYRLEFEVSDYFAMDPVVLTDLLGDGLEIDPATATFAVEEHGVTTTGPFALGVDLDVDESDHTCGGGTTALTFDLSSALTTAGADSTLEGGLVGGAFGPTRGVVQFEADVLDSYRCLPGDPSLDPGDTVVNDVSIAGTVDVDGGGTPTDSSSAESTVELSNITKTVYARNGEIIPPGGPPPQFGPGDEITFRFQFPVGSSDMEALVFTDYLPLPSIQVQPSITVINDICGIPAPGTLCLGPDDTFHLQPGAPAATVTTDPATNSFTVDYGTFDNPDNPSTLIDAVGTAVIEDDPFRDGLLLVNQMDAVYENSTGESRTSTSVAPFEVQAPGARLTKGVVDTDNVEASYSGGPQQPTGGVTYGGTDLADCGESLEGGVLTNVNLSGSPDADVSGIDAGDLVRFAIVVENPGSGPNGAFDVAIADEIPAGLQIPAGGIDLCVTDGTGAEFEIEDATGMFSVGSGVGPLAGTLELADPGPTATPIGGLDSFDTTGTSGRDLAVISYTLQATSDLPELTTAVNTATVDNFSATEGGPDYTVVQPPADLTDTATVSSRSATVSKSLDATDQAHTTGSNVVVGETATYEVVVDVPEGEFDDTTLVDTLPPGLAVVSIDSITASPGVSTSVPGSFAAVADAAEAALSAPGQTIAFDFDTLTNDDRDNTAVEQLTVTYTVVVLDVVGNQDSTNLQNSVVFTYGGRSTSPASATVTVREPVLQVDKSVSPAVADAGDTVTYTISVTNAAPSTEDAFDVTLQDVLPAGLDYVDGSFTSASGAPPTDIDDSGVPTLTASWDTLALGTTAVLQYQMTVPEDIVVPQQIDNTAEAEWTSVPGDGATTEYSSDDRERTGPSGPGATGVDDYIDSDTAQLRIGGATIVKSINATSAPSTANPNVTIGEVITYDLFVTLPEGQGEDLVVTDLLPPGLAYVAGTLEVLTTAGSGTAPNTVVEDFAGTLGESPFVVTGGAGDGDDVIVTFPGTSTNPADVPENTDNDSFVVRLDAVVLDVAGNVGVPPQTTLLNQGSVAADGSAPVLSNQIVSPVVEPQLSIAKAVSPTTYAVDVGGTFTITIEVENVGTSTAFGVLVQDVLPDPYDETTAVNVDDGGFAYSRLGSVVTYQGGDIPAGASVTFVMTVDIPPLAVPAGTPVTNEASASNASTLPGVVAGERTEPTVTDTATVNATDVDLTLAKDDGVTTVVPGQTVTYDLVARNAGGAAAANVTITDTLPPNMTFVSVGGADCALVSQTGQDVVIDITIGAGPAVDLNPGESVTCQVSAIVADPLPAGVTTFRNVAVVVDGTGNDPTPANNVAVDTDTKDASATPDLVVAKDDGLTTVSAGQRVTYTVDVSNVGNVGATNVVLTDTIPVDTSFVSCAAPGSVSCVYDISTNRVIATYAGLDGDGATVSLDVTVDVSDPLPPGVDDIVNVATAADDGANGPDPTPANNTDDDIDVVDATPDMAIIKTADAEDVAPGDTYTYTLTAGNLGDQEATGVTVTDLVPPGLTVICGSVTPTPATCDPVSGVLSWGPAPANGLPSPWLVGVPYVGSYSVTVDDPAVANQTVFPNTATIADDGLNGADPDLSNNSSTEQTELVDFFPDLEVTKDDGVTEVEPGEPTTYTVTVQNTGNIGAANVVVTDTLPPGTTFVSCVTAPTPPTLASCGESSPGVVTATYSEIAGGGTQVETLQIDVEIDDPQPAAVETLTNTVVVADDGTNGVDPTPENNTDTDIDTLVATPDMAVTKNDGVQDRIPTDEYTYTMNVANVGDQAATGVIVRDTLPVGTSYVSCTGASSCAAVGRVVTWTFTGEFPAGTDTDVTVTVSVDDPAPAGLQWLDNSVLVSDDGSNGIDPDPSNNDDTDRDALVAAPDMSVTKDDGVDTVEPGDTVTYTITVANGGVQDATGVTVTDTLPAELNFVSCDPVCDSSAEPVIVWSFPTFAAGDSVELELVATVDESVPAGLTTVINTVVVADDGANGADPTPENNTDTDPDSLDAVPDMSITKLADDDTVTTGQTYGYTLTADNVGNQEATGVTITDQVPPGLTVDCSSVTPAAATCTPGTGVLVWGPAPASGLPSPWPVDTPVELTYSVTVVDPAAANQTSFPNTAAIADDSLNGVDPDLSNNSATEETELVEFAVDLEVEKDDGVVTVAPGDTTTYSVIVQNTGDIGAADVVVTDTLPPGTTFLSCTTSPTVVACDETAPGSGVVEATYPTIAGGGTQIETIEIEVEIDDPQAAGVDSLTNTVVVDDDGTNGVDPTPENNTDTDVDDLDAAPDLEVTKNDGVQARFPGEQYTYTITVTNDGDQAATGVVVTDTLPAGVTFVSCEDDVCSVAGSVVTWNLPGTFDVGDVAVLTVTVEVVAPVPAGILLLVNTVTVADDGANGPDPTPENNTDTDTDGLLSRPDMRVTKDDGVDSVAPGDVVTYDITVDNIGLQDATGVVVTDTLPAELTFVSCDPACDTSALPVVTWTFDTFPSGDSVDLQIVAEVPDSVPAGVDEITNVITVADDGENGPDLTPLNNRDEDTDVLDAVPDLVVTKTDGRVRVEGGDRVAYVIIVRNVGDQDATGVVLTDTLPDGVTFVSCTGGCDPSAAPVITWPIGNLASGGSQTFALVVDIDDPVADGTTEYVNVARAADDGTNGRDPTPLNNRDTDVDTYGADLSVTKDDGRTTVVAGEAVTYTITVTNNGPSDVTTFTLTDTPPAELSDLVFAPSTGTYNAATGVWSGVGLAPGESVTMTVTALVDPSAVGPITNTVTVELPAGFTDPTPENNIDDDTDTVTVVNDATIVKDGPTTALSGDLVTYTMVVTNLGPSTATGIVVTDPIPAGLFWVGGSGAPWTCTGTTTISCAYAPPLPVGATATLELQFRITAGAGTVVNVAEVTTDGCNCDTDDASTIVQPVGNLPATGSTIGGLLVVAALALGAGVLLDAIRRRQRPSTG